MAYLNSDEIQMYPSSFREHSDDPKSYLNTEYNLVNTKRLSEKDEFNSYVIDGGETLTIYLGGYRFEVNKKTLTSKNIGTNIWAGIKLIDEDIYYNKNTSDTFKNKRLDNIDSTGSKLDVNKEFRGIAFFNSKPEGYDYTIEVLADNEVPSASKLKLNSDEISNKGSDDNINETFTTKSINADSINNIVINTGDDKTSLKIIPAEQPTVYLSITDSGHLNISNTLDIAGAISTLADFKVGDDSNKGSVSISAQGGVSSTIIGPQGTITLPSNNTTSDDKAFVQRNSTSSWCKYTSKMESNTIVMRDEGGSSSFSNIKCTSIKGNNSNLGVWINNTGELKSSEFTFESPSTSPDNPTNEFIDTVSQNSIGQITATKKSLSVATSDTLGGIKVANAQDTDKYPKYAVRLDDGNKAYVNVSWTDTEYVCGSPKDYDETEKHPYTQGTFYWAEDVASIDIDAPESYEEIYVYGLGKADTPTFASVTVSSNFNVSSDRRLKENIKEYKRDSSILDLPVVEYDYKNTNVHSMGCIAQDLQKLFPDLVDEDSDGYLSVRETKLVYLLIDEVKKLRDRIDKLEGK